MSEMVKIKKADSLSMWKEREKIGKAIAPKEKDRECPYKYVNVANKSPASEASIAKELLHKLVTASFFLKSRDPMAPTKNNEIKPKKMYCSVIAVIIRFEGCQGGGKEWFWGWADLRGYYNLPVSLL